MQYFTKCRTIIFKIYQLCFAVRNIFWPGFMSSITAEFCFCSSILLHFFVVHNPFGRGDTLVPSKMAVCCVPVEE